MKCGILRKAEGGRLLFWCPACDGAHAVRIDGGSPSWGFNGDYERPTFTPSIHVNPGRSNPQAHSCHSFVTDGKIAYLADCSHTMAGLVVPLPSFDGAA